MRRFVSALVVSAFLATGCASEPTQPTDTTTTSTTTTVAACTPVFDATSSLVASTTHAQLDVYDTPGGTVTQQLASPRPLGADPDVTVPLALLVTDRTGDCAWLQVLLPQRPNGASGWVRTADVDLARVQHRVDVSVADRTLTLSRAGVLVATYPIAVGAAATPTPTGTFFVTELVSTPANGPYGPFALGLSGFSDALDTFNGLPAQIAIHGTNSPSLIGQEVSNGCLRLRNDHVRELAAVLALGTPVIIAA